MGLESLLSSSGAAQPAGPTKKKKGEPGGRAQGRPWAVTVLWEKDHKRICKTELFPPATQAGFLAVFLCP